MSVQILFVQGGGEGAHDEWDDRLVDSLTRELGDGFEIRYPRMPREDDPSFERWGPAIRREMAALDDGAIVVGHSVGGTLLIRALAEQRPAQQLGAIVLLAAPFVGAGGWPDDGFEMTSDLGDRLPDGVPVHLFHGLDDDTAPAAHADLYAGVIPGAKVHRLPGRDHQLGNDLAEVAEVIRALREPAGDATAGERRGRGVSDRFALVPVFPALETGRLLLRELTEADAPWYLAHFSRPEIVIGSGFPAPADLDAAREELHRFVLDLFARRTGLRWGLVLRGGQELIGSAGLYAWRDDPEPTAELGYDLAPEFWGRGLMTEALAAIAGYAFDTLGIARLEATVVVGNERSCRTLERSGFRHEGVLPAHGEDEHGRLVDEHLYARRRGT